MRRFHHVAAAAALLVVLPLVAAATGGKAPPAAAKAPAAAPPNITALMAKGGCKSFASLVAASPDARATFQSAVAAGGGVTAFCPSDAAVRSFAPAYRNLTTDGKASLLLFHAVPAYYSLRSLKSSNGVMNTLATDGAAGNYSLTVQNDRGDEVTLRTGSASASAARIESTVYDRDPVAVYALDAVLEPVELFDDDGPVEAPAPAPAPAAADAPKKAPTRRHVAADAPAADDGDAAPADDRKKKGSKTNAAPGALCLRRLAAVPIAVAVAAVLAW